MIELVIADRNWRKPGLAAHLKRAAAAALGAKRGSLTLLLTDDARLKALNHTFRGKNKPTNVLSFPSEAKDYLGDVALAYGVTAREARAAGRSLSDHAAHLAVHGVLHLLGYDHETTRQAATMEPLEMRILEKLGISDPYAVRA
jgi:probable rRNA maturation factor